MNIDKELSAKQKEAINQYIELLNNMTTSYLTNKFNNQVTNESFNLLLNGNIGYLANIIFMLACSVQADEESHAVLAKIKTMFDEYMEDIKQKLFN